MARKTISKDVRRQIGDARRLFGTGLILFDSAKPEDPHFSIRARAIKQEPDMFYVSKYMRFIEAELFS